MGVKAKSHPALCVIRQMLGVVAPPCAVVVPQVVVRILSEPEG